MAKKRKAKAWRDPHDWYCEDAAPVESLFDNYRFSDRVYDPCCGRGNIPDVARRWGCNVVATDLIDRGYAHLTATGNFLDSGFRKEMATGVDHIVFNPPYSYIKGICQAMIEAALSTDVRTVSALVPVSFLGSIERNSFFNGANKPTQLAFLSARPSMPPGEKLAELGKKAFKGGRIVYVWMHWDRTKLPKPPIWLPAWEGQP